MSLLVTIKRSNLCFIVLALLVFKPGYSLAQNVGINNTNPLSTLDVSGSVGHNIRVVSSTATLASTDATIMASPGITLTLPASSTVTRRIIRIVFNGSYGSSAVTINPAGTDHIISNNISYNAASGILLAIGSIDLQTDGSGNWYATMNLGAQGGNDWLLSGNSGINQPAVPATYGTSAFGASENWIGNTDAKDFAIGTSSKERIRVLSTGNVGIGTAAPGATLDVNGYNVTTGNALNITANSLTTGTGLNVNSSGTITSPGEVAQLTGNSVTTGNILTLSGTGLTTGSAISATAGTTTGSAVSIISNGVTTGNGISLSANGLTSGNGLKISTSSTAISTGNLINVTSTGNNSGNTITGISSVISGSNGTSIAAQFSASGATNNYGLIVPAGGGFVGIGTSTPNRALVVMNNGTNNVATIENTNAAGYSSIDMYDNSGSLASTFGYGNSSAAAPFTSRGYFNTYGHDFVWMNSVVGAVTPVLLVSGQAGTPGYIGIQTLTPGQLLELAPTTGTIRIDGLKSGNSYNSSSTATTSTILYSNNSTGDVFSLPTVNNASLVTDATGIPSWKTGTSNGLFWSITGNSGISASTSAIGTTANNDFYGTTDANPVVITTGGYERMRITAAGNIGIQNTAPSALLDIKSSATSNAFNVTTGNVVNIAGNALTTGTLLNVTSSGTITSGGNAEFVAANSATTGNILTLLGTSLTSGSILSATAGTTTGNAVAITANGITTGTGLNLTSNGLTSGNGLSISSSSTAGAGSGSSYLVNLSESGANSNASHTAYGIKASVTNTGTTSTNVAAQFSASGATNNYGVLVSAGNSGFGTTTPNTKVDVNGDLAIRANTITLSNVSPATNDDVAIGSYSFIRVTGPTSNFIITGLAGGYDGKIVTLYNATSFQMQISSLNASSSAANQINVLNGASIHTNHAGTVTLLYDAVSANWIVIATYFP